MPIFFLHKLFAVPREFVEDLLDLRCAYRNCLAFLRQHSFGPFHSIGSTLFAVSGSEPVAFFGSFGVGSSGNAISLKDEVPAVPLNTRIPILIYPGAASLLKKISDTF